MFRFTGKITTPSIVILATAGIHVEAGVMVHMATSDKAGSKPIATLARVDKWIPAVARMPNVCVAGAGAKLHA